MENTTLAEQGAELISTVFEGILNKLVVSVIILLLGFVVGKLAGKLITRVLSDFKANKTLKKATGMRIHIEEIIGGFITYFIYFITVIMALNQMGVTTDILNIISAAIMVIIVLSIFLGIKDFIPNAISGIIINKKGFIKEGDYIQIENISGRVDKIHLIETILITDNDDIINIPNSNLTKKSVKKLRHHLEK